MNLESDVRELKGVGDKKAQLLAKLNIFAIGDLLMHYPRTYQDRTNIKRIAELRDGEEVLTSGTVLRMQLTGKNYRKPTLRLLVDDGSGQMEVIFFNGKWLQSSFTIGQTYTFFGKSELQYGRRNMLHPEFSRGDSDESETILPIYPLTEGLKQSELRKWIRQALDVIDESEEHLPASIVEKYQLCPYGYALKHIHYPENRQGFKVAKYRLAFEELFILQVGLMFLRSNTVAAKGIVFSKNAGEDQFIKNLPYSLTGAQARVVSEICHDMESDSVMNRLVQGDVGSGKTAVAEIALFKAVRSGYQGAMMAPTEILAQQHYAEMSRIFEPYGIKVGFLGGSLTAKEKRNMLGAMASGDVDIVVGTHALVQEGVEFDHLGLVITDEQHRFGVNQRKTLSRKGDNPDMLVMTATPIPRTLAVILYGDLDISIIDELPPGRQTIKTKAVTEKERIKVYEFMRKEVASGRQCYVVAPLIEDSETLEIRSAESIYEEIKDGFREFNVALLHGEMKQSEKDDIMSRFASGEINVLVSTVVIEVGINVPNATLMIIENSERFGLAQLHQLRGRVGRGTHQSYCVLVLGGGGEVAKQRAEIMCESSDGFYISEKDLELRGPGEIFGTRQHGIPDLKVADLAKHTQILAASQAAAKELLNYDSALVGVENKGIREQVSKLFGNNMMLQM